MMVTPAFLCDTCGKVFLHPDSAWECNASHYFSEDMERLEN